MKKKILFVINTMGRAGAERALISFINSLPREEYDISLLSLINRGETFDEVPEYVTILNKKPDNRSVLSFRGKLALIYTTLRCFFYHLRGVTLIGYFLKNLWLQCKKHQFSLDKLLWRIIAKGTKAPEETYDVAVAYLEGGSTYFVADSVHARKKAAFIHIDYKKAGYGPALDLNAYDKIDRVFSVSEEAGNSFLQLYPQHSKKLFLFRNIIDKERIQKKSELPLPADDPFIQSTADIKLLTVGRLHPQKAYDIAIPALRMLRERGLSADWFVLGEGALEKELKRQIQSEQLQEHFILLGSKENPYPYYRLATLYIHATRFEGKSIAIEEAQILGKAIIASDCTGNREQIQNNENGLLIPLTSEAIADAVVQLLQHPEQKTAFEKANAAIDLSHKEDFSAFYELFS